VKANTKSVSVTRPGITAATLKANGIEYLDTVMELMEYGFKDPGTVIPHRKFPGGETIIDGENPYARNRLAKPQGKKKYHQNYGTTTHAYIPVGLPQHEVAALVIVEGEFKAMSLVEAGIPAVGMSGFYGYRYGKDKENAGQMVSELVAVLAVLKPKTILFLGDNDTALNFQFADAAVGFAKLVPKCTVTLPRIPLNMPKGIDDVRENLGGKFDAFWKSIVADAIPVKGTDDRAELAEKMLRRELDHIRQADEQPRQECYQKLAKLSSFYKKAERNRFVKIAQELGITTADFDQLLKAAFDKRSEEDKKKAGRSVPTPYPPSTPPPATSSMPATPIAPAKMVTWPRITNALDIINDTSIKLPPQLVEGLIHKGTKTVIGGCSKIGKTNIGLDLAFSVNAGVPFWGRKSKATKVLFINFEIQAPFMQQRLTDMRKAKGLFDAPLPDVWSLRGYYPSAEELVAELLTVISKSEYGLIIIDPIYKLLGGLDESCGWQVNLISNQLDQVCMNTGAAVVYTAHFPKGDNSNKGHMDRISGSGVFGRDPDSIITVTDLDYPDRRAFAIEATLRNFTPMKSFAVESKYPIMVLNSDLNPNKLKTSGRKALCSVADVTALLEKPMRSTEWMMSAKKKFGVSDGTYYRLRREALSADMVEMKDKLYRLPKNESAKPEKKAKSGKKKK
jgi:hypothetical protein